MAAVLTGRRKYFFFIIMTQGIRIGVHITVTAGTGMGRIALFRTGRLCYHFGIFMHMVRSRNTFGFFFLTTLTASLGKTCFRFRCFLHRFPFAKVMAEGIGIIANVAVATLAGKRGITLFRTGRRRYGFCVYMLMFLPRDFTGFFFTAAFAASLFSPASSSVASFTVSHSPNS